MRELNKRPNLHYTYRFLILPETIGSIAYLSHNEDLIPKIKGGLFLEMLGLENPHALQLSFKGNTSIDQCFTLALQAHDPDGWTGAFRTVIGNDERQFNAPGVRVPMLSLSRVLPPSSPDWPYQEYHSSCDTPSLVSEDKLQDSRSLVLRMIDTLENNRTPINRFKGEIFLSRYSLHIDFFDNPDDHRKLVNIMDLIDGTHSIAEIAHICNLSFEATKQIIDEFHHHSLVEYCD
jgi:aminopeptidase-like protein